MMSLEHILTRLDEYDIENNDLYSKEIHKLGDEESELLTVKDFLLNVLFDRETGD